MLHYTQHAIKQMIARQIGDTDVQAVIRHAAVTYEQSYRGSRQRVHQHGDLTVVTNTVVVTVLLNRKDEWTDEDARNRSR